MRRSRIKIRLPATSYEERCAARDKARVEEIDALPVSNDYLEQVVGLQERNANTHPNPVCNYYACPECEDDVEVALPVSKHATCEGCGTLLEVHPDADFDEGGWHDRTTLSIAKEGA